MDVDGKNIKHVVNNKGSAVIVTLKDGTDYRMRVREILPLLQNCIFIKRKLYDVWYLEISGIKKFEHKE